ncbi:hypothetical protein BGZ54_003228, partial [Gamsiella multidivaricata]
SARRSNRGGHSKQSRKKEEEDDGGQTRCVCNQQHHEGVMIQCEICKVWQHCPCVGLGDGEVTPDQYYCDSCRPENHPYKVVNGQLVSNSKSNLAQKPTKKRSTMNSKEASIPMDLMLAQQKWNEEHQDELEDEFALRTSSKRRRKTSSTHTDINDDSHHHQDSSKSKDIETASFTSSHAYDNKKDKAGQASNDHDSSSSSSPSSSPKTSSPNHGRMGSKKTSVSKPSSKGQSRSTSPASNGSISHHHQQSESFASAKSEEDAKRNAAVDSMGPSSKRRKTNRSDMTSHAESASPGDEDGSVNKEESSEDRPDTPSRTRKGIDSCSHQQVPSVLSPVSSTKKALPRRNGDRGHSTRNGSRHSTPVPNGEGTPQPMAPPAPAAIRYPSSRMTIHEMTKRAKQLLDYISRVQIDMADRKSKSGSQSPLDDSSLSSKSGTPSLTDHQHQHQQHQHQHQHHDDNHSSMQNDVNSKEPSVFRLPASASVSAVTMHGDSQVCPDLSRSSMDSTVSLVDGLHEPSSPTDTKVPTTITNGIGKEMTIRVVPLSAQDRLPLLSTPPLSVHDHHHHHHRHSSGTPESETTHEPMTPPHHPSDGHDQRSSENKADPAGTTTSMELMDKLTGDLIRFQEKFGSFV